MQAILVPVKPLDHAKRRLAGLLRVEDRRRLGLTMLADVLRAIEKWESRFVVTSDPDAEAVALAFGCHLIADRGEDLNDALEGGSAATATFGADSLLIVPSDVPLVSPDEVTALFASEADVAAVTSLDGGTNALRRTPVDVIRCSFGPRSIDAHRAAAESKGLTFDLLNLPGLELDVDSPSDLERLASAEGERDSIRFARTLLG